MDKLTDRQQIFYNYLLDRLDYINDDFFNKYVDQLSMRSGDLEKFVEKLPDYHPWFQTDKNGNEYQRPLSVLDIFALENTIRYKKRYTKKTLPKRFISATDIASYTYCPVSFSISNTFQLLQRASAALGTSLHEEHKLLNFVDYQSDDKIIVGAGRNIKKSLQRVEKTKAFEFINDLEDSIAIYLGSTKNDNHKLFIGKDGVYVGQPDYIFYNRRLKMYFVVEEKFQYVPDEQSKNYSYSSTNEIRTSSIVYENHLNQLRSYLYGIKEYSLSHGYLVNWQYSLDWKKSKINSGPPLVNIKQINTHKIDSKDQQNRKAVIDVYKKIQHTIREKGGSFEKNYRIASKCAGCVVSYLCGHKTGRYDRFEFPYSEKHFQLKNVPFPEELKKKPLTTETMDQEISL